MKSTALASVRDELGRVMAALDDDCTRIESRLVARNCPEALAYLSEMRRRLERSSALLDRLREMERAMGSQEGAGEGR